MLATLPEIEKSNGTQYDKTQIEQYYVVGVNDKGELHEFIDCRVYMTKSGSVKYASLWIHGNNHYMSGKGSAGGGGYCKTSAAIAAAISSAGIKLDESVGGRGESVAKEALLAIAQACGAKGELLILG